MALKAEEAHPANRLRHEVVVEAAEAGATVGRAEVRTAVRAGTKAALHLWLMDDGIPMGCRCCVCAIVPKWSLPLMEK